MLIRFAVANHRSIQHPVELSLVAVDADRPSARHFERLPNAVLTLAAIYGPNASGKSNVLDALGWLSNAVRSSLSQWQDQVPRDPFKFAGGSELPTIFEIEFLVDDVRHFYTVHVDDHSVLYEELTSYPERRARQLFIREGNDVHLRRGTQSASALRELAKPTNALLLSSAARLDVPYLASPARFLASMANPFPRRRGGRPGRLLQPLRTTNRLFIEEHRARSGESPSNRFLPSEAATARAMLKHADLGILDVLVKEDKEEEQFARYDVRLVHRASSDVAEFAMADESDGTQMWFRLIGPVLSALRRGEVLLLDEIDASLHPKLSMELLEAFRSPTSNPHNAQLIFTTHDTTLMGELNRDEVWLTEKGDDGATLLTGLAEFGGDRVRRSMNLERAYLQGRFGAVPRLGRLPVDRLLDVPETYGDVRPEGDQLNLFMSGSEPMDGDD